MEKMRRYSGSIASAVNKFLVEDDWKFSFDENIGIFRFGLRLKGKIKSIDYAVDVKDDSYIVYAISPLGADSEDTKMMSNMAEFICRANYGLKNGNFEMDMRDGEIRFKCYVDCDEIVPSLEMVKNSIHCSAAMFEHYGDGIVDVIFGNMSAKEAIEKCEKVVAEDLFAMLGGSIGENEDTDAMMLRIASKLGIDLTDDKENEKSKTTDDEMKVNMDPFKTEGGVA